MGTRENQKSRMARLTDDASSEWSARVDQRFEDNVLRDAESTQGALEHPNWTLDNLDTRGGETGMKLASNNVQRKLYASVVNMTETMGNMVNIWVRLYCDLVGKVVWCTSPEPDCAT